jgi:hypothetical protein
LVAEVPCELGGADHVGEEDRSEPGARGLGHVGSLTQEAATWEVPRVSFRPVPPGGVGPDLRRVVWLRQRLLLRLKRSRLTGAGLRGVDDVSMR